MKTWILVLLLTFLTALAGCAPVSSETQRDLYSDAQNARATADAAKDLAEYQERFLTATAEAPIVHITETAAAMAIQQQYWTVTAQSVRDTQTSALTQTAMAWTSTPNATNTAVFAALNAEGTQIANNVTRDNLELERQAYTNNFWAILPGITFAIVAGVLIMGVIWVSRRERYRPATVDARGNVLPILDVVDGTITDVDRNPNYRGLLSDNLLKRWLETKLQLPATVPDVTAARQDATTQRDQLLDLSSRGLPESGQKAESRKRLAGQEMTRQLATPNLESRFKIMTDPSNLDVIDGQIIDVLDHEWKEAEQK